MLYHGLTDNRRHSGALRMHARAHASRKVTSAKGLCVVSSCGLSSIFALVSVLFWFLAFSSLSIFVSPRIQRGVLVLSQVASCCVKRECCVVLYRVKAVTMQV